MIVRKSNTYKLLTAVISCQSNLWVIRIKAVNRISAMFFEARQAFYCRSSVLRLLGKFVHK